MSVFMNLLTNPSFEATSGTVEVRRNLVANPAGTAPTTDGFSFTPQWYGGAPNGGATTYVSDATDGPEVAPGVRLKTYGRKTWTAVGGSTNAISWSLSRGARAAVSVGSVYTASLYWRTSLALPSMAQNLMIAEFYDAATGGTKIGTTVPGDTFPAPGANQWQRVSSTFTVPAGATHVAYTHLVTIDTNDAKVGMTIDGSGGMVELSPVLGQYFDGSVSPDSDLTASWTGAANASPSILTGAKVSGVTSTAMGQSVQYATGDASVVGTRALRAQVLTTAAIGLPVTDVLPTAGTTHTLLLRARARTRTATVTPRIRGVAGAPVTLPAGQWVEVRMTAVAGTGTVIQTGLLLAGDSGHQPGDLIDIDKVALIEGVYEGPAFDGSSTSDTDRIYAWTGTPNASTSTSVPTPGLRVEGFTDAPCPRVGITLDGLATTGPSRVTLWRSTAGGQRRKVRGWDRRQVYGSDYAIDYETPLGRPVRYDLVVDTGPTVPLRVSDTVTLNTATGYIQDPLQPLGAVPMSGTRAASGPVLRSAAFQSMEYTVASTQVQVMGRRDPVALTGQRMAASGLAFPVFTHAAEQATALRNLLTETSLVLVRPLPEWGPLPDLIYTVPSVTEELVDVSWGGSMTRWHLAGDSVAPPSIQVLVALWTYDQVAALWSTYASAQAAATATAARYIDVQRDPTMGV